MSVINRKDLELAVQDLWDGIRGTLLWLMLGWQDIKQRYRRSVIGPFWLTLSYGAMIAGMGPLYGSLLQQDISTYFPYLATGFVVWFLIALFPSARRSSAADPHRSAGKRRLQRSASLACSDPCEW